MSLQSDFQNFIHLSKYSRWRDDLGRRETWEETVQRYIDFFDKHIKTNVLVSGVEEFELMLEKTRQAILNLQVVPSMRALKTAGLALEKHNAGGYNCSFTAIDHPHTFDEILYLSCCGCGVGFSVEQKHISKLPEIPLELYPTDTLVYVGDSKIGWSTALREIISLLYAGKIPKWDVSRVRPYGSILKTFGGRASGPGPLVDLFEFVIQTFKKATGRKLNSLECHDIVCKIGLIAESGGTRRAALLSLSDLDDVEMRHAKSGNWWSVNDQRAYANNSATYYTKPELGKFMDEWVSLYRSKSGERGIFNLSNLKINNDRRDWSKVSGVNPCIVGNTLVYVADGRGFVSIKELAETNLDIPVFCYDDKYNLNIRYMRNPRITGKNVPIYKITLENGHIIRTTKNHKFLTKENSYIELKDLKVGDSLNIITRFKASIKDVFPNANSHSQDYFWINNGFSKNKLEHRNIAEFFYNCKIPKNYVVHHKNFNAQDNYYKNLEIMTKIDHDFLHSRNMLGDKNPIRRAKIEWNEDKWIKYKKKHSDNNIGEKNKNYGGYTNEDLKKHAMILTKRLNCRFSTQDWSIYAKENGLPQNFSNWRKNNIGNIKSLALWAANKCFIDVEIISLDPRMQKRYNRLLDQGYECVVKNGEISFNKNCEGCGKKFITKDQEIMFCSTHCSNKINNLKYKEKMIEGMKLTWHNKKEKIREEQIKIYSKLKFGLQREPTKKEWQSECKKLGISFEISRKTSPFRFWGDLEKFANTYNHKIISIELDGFEDVYNGTVDEFHNFFVGGFLEKQKNGKDKWILLNTKQCGEILLRSSGFCNLSEVIVRPDDEYDELANKVKLASFIGTMQATLTKFKYLRKIWQKNAEEERLLGVSLTGILDCPFLVQNAATRTHLKELKQLAIDTNIYWSQKFNINPSVAVTTIKPSGNTSQLSNTASGIHPRYSPYYIRTVRMDKKDPLSCLMVDQGFPYEDCVLKPQNTYIFSFPIKSPEKSIFRNDLGAIGQLELCKKFKQNWAEHNVSCTVYIKDNEWLDVASWVHKNFDFIGGIAFLPNDLGTYKQAPYQEITEQEYFKFLEKMPKSVDWSAISEFEKEDQTKCSKELACQAGCELSI